MKHLNLRGTEYNWGKFSAIFHKPDNIPDFHFALLQTKPHLKGVYSKRKEFAPPKGPNSFLLD